MGNREALIDGAKKCLNEKGYTRTTARDVATASGVSLAAIGYHFGSKDALLQAALFEAMQEWGEDLGRAFATDIDPDATPAERFEARWRRVIDSFGRHRPFWLMQFEMVAQAEHVPELRKTLAAGVEAGRRGLAELFDSDAELGALYQVLLSGVLMQWLIDPATAPTAKELGGSLGKLSGYLAAGPAGPA
ncbi:MAG TPA: TetR/AcrR family transcriptional regulator [Candidatus Limnocylindrales bacterium]